VAEREVVEMAVGMEGVVREGVVWAAAEKAAVVRVEMVARVGTVEGVMVAAVLVAVAREVVGMAVGEKEVVMVVGMEEARVVGMEAEATAEEREGGRGVAATEAAKVVGTVVVVMVEALEGKAAGA
jgi:hypothetical protein